MHTQGEPLIFLGRMTAPVDTLDKCSPMLILVILDDPKPAFILIICGLHIGLRTYVTEQLQQLGYKPCRMLPDGHVPSILCGGMDGESRFRPGQHHYVAVPDIEPTAWGSQLSTSPGAGYNSL